jgi:hypothetical protein
MFWRKPKRKTEAHTQRTVSFVGEQDGEPERLLTNSLATEFRNVAQLKRAYLARVEYADGTHVALCLAAPQDPLLVERIGARFSEIFGAPFHYALAARWTAQRAAAQLRR